MGALLAARELGIASGGVAPRGWLTEIGPQEALLRSFGLIECASEGYAARTKENILQSDGTLLIGPYQDGGSKLTYKVAMEVKKPLFLVGYPDHQDAGAALWQWLAHRDIQILNVAGNRESQSPGIAEFTRSFLIRVIRVICG